MNEAKLEAQQLCRDAAAAVAAGDPMRALRCATEAQSADAQLAKAWYISGCAHYMMAGYGEAYVSNEGYQQQYYQGYVPVVLLTLAPSCFIVISARAVLF